MAVLKPTTSRPAHQAAIAFSMKDVEEAARQMLLGARQQAEQLLAASQDEAARARAAARAEGHAEGHAEGLRQGTEQGRRAGHEAAIAEHRPQLSQLVTTLGQAIAQIDAQRCHIEAEGLHQVVALALAVARRVTKRQGAIDPRVLAENLGQAMRLVAHAADLRVHIHPSQHTLLADLLPRLAMQWPTLAHAQLVDDPAVSPGGCRLSTHAAVIDATLEAQLDRIVEDLMPSDSILAQEAPAA